MSLTSGLRFETGVGRVLAIVLKKQEKYGNQNAGINNS
jgi:hypothetical protein